MGACSGVLCGRELWSVPSARLVAVLSVSEAVAAHEFDLGRPRHAARLYGGRGVTHRSPMPKLKLTYFDMPGGRGQAARLALDLGEIPYEDDRVKFAEFLSRTPGS